MGAPELPTDPGDDELNMQSEHIQHAPMPSDDSDNEGVYDGYEQLAMVDEDSLDVDDNNENSVCVEDNLLNSNVTSPQVESIYAEIERQVWSEPRPEELQIELDSTKTEQILLVMSNISLPSSSIPDWARGVPEDRWKDELLQRIRQLK